MPQEEYIPRPNGGLYAGEVYSRAQGGYNYRRSIFQGPRVGYMQMKYIPGPRGDIYHRRSTYIQGPKGGLYAGEVLSRAQGGGIYHRRSIFQGPGQKKTNRQFR